MSKTVGANLTAHLAGIDRTTALNCKIKRVDGTIVGLTDHDQDLSYDLSDGDGSTTYAADSGQIPSEASASSDLSVSNLTIGSYFTATGINRDDLIKGLFSYAEIKFFLLNWNDTTMGDLKFPLWGRLGKTRINDNGFEADLRGLEQFLQNPVGEVSTPYCRAEFGDSRCTLAVADYTETITIDNTAGGAPADPTNNVFYGTVTETQGHLNNEADWYTFGYLTWTAGNNNGLSREIRAHSISGSYACITLLFPMESTVADGDTASIVAGCAKTPTHCTTKFDSNNIGNFRGEHLLPGRDTLAAIGIR